MGASGAAASGPRFAGEHEVRGLYRQLLDAGNMRDADAMAGLIPLGQRAVSPTATRSRPASPRDATISGVSRDPAIRPRPCTVART